MDRKIGNIVLILFIISSTLISSCQSTSKRTYVSIGNQYAKDGLLREAIESYKKSIAVRPKNFTAYRNLGMVLVKVGNYKDAVRYLDKAMYRYSNNFDANFYLGEAYRALENYADAIFHYQKSLKIKSLDSKALKALAWSYFRIRYYSEALQTARKLQKVEPRDAQTAIIIARTYLKIKRYREALKTIRASKEDAEKFDLAYLHSVEGDIMFEVGAVKKAMKLYKLAVKQQPLLAGALLGLGKCYLEEKKFKVAITYMERALRIRPYLTETHLLLGKAYEKINSQKAVKHYQLFRRQASTDPEYISLLTDVKKRISSLRKSKKRGNAKENL
ncbi:MAG: tetratricopeptide repeat protein [Oligoflexales bacterium]